MRASRGFTTIEVVVALALLLSVGGVIIRGFQAASSSQRAAEAAQSGTSLLKTAVEVASREPQAWLPNADGTTSLTPDQIRSLLARTPEVTYTDPNLYEVQAARQGDNTLKVTVCVRPAGERYCFNQDGLYIARSAKPATPRPPPPSLPPAQTGTGHLTLNLSAPSGAPTNVTLSGASSSEGFSAAGIYDRNLLPGSYTLEARTAVDNRYSYDPIPAGKQGLQITTGRSITQSISYDCSTGALQVNTYYPQGYSPAPNTVLLNPGNKDLSNGGLVPYLTPGNYSLSAQNVGYSGYTYQPTVTPSGPLAVSPCTTPSASVNYTAIDGVLVVNVGPQSLTDLANTDLVNVSGPAGARWAQLGTNTYNYLAPGTYSLTPQSPLVNGVRYRAAGPQSATVNPGQTSQATLTYAPVSGRIRVEATPPPENLTPRFTLTGPSNYSASGSGTGQDFDDLAPGDYAVSFDVLQGSSYTYGVPGSPLGVSLAAGDRKTVQGSYAALTGALTVGVNGLPAADLYRYVSVNSNSLPANPYTYSYLTPGTYPVQAQPFVYGGYTWTPDQASQNVTVTAGNTATASVTYTRQAGTVTVTVSGLPPSASANATLTLPDGTPQGVTTTQTFTGMPTGTYRLSASQVVVNGVTYQPSIAPAADQPLPNGGSITYTLTYTAITGSLNLLINGAPGQVDVTGPSYARTVSGSNTLLTDLTPGTYQLTPRDTTQSQSTPYGNLTYTWSAPPSTVNVVAGPNPDQTVTYTRQAGNLALSWNAPGGTGRLDITGPGGFSTSLSVSGSNSQTLSDLPTGSYQLSPQDYTAGGITYGATATTTTVTNGATASASLSWQPKTGRIAVTVTGAPTPPTLRLLAGGNLVATQTGASVAFDNLPPGTYRVEGDGLNSGGFGYSAVGVDVNVTAGATSTVTLTYVKQSGYLKIAQSGYSGTGSTTLSPGGTLNLPGTYEVATGSYTLTINDVTDPSTGILYKGSLSLGSSSGRTLSFTVSAGATLNITATYTAQAATLTLAVSGLPSGASPTYTVSGSRATYSASGGNNNYTFTLPYDTYTISAADALYGNYRYRASVSPGSVNLTANTTVGVTYTAVSGALTVNISQSLSSSCTVTVSLSGLTSRSASRTGSGSLTFNDLPPGNYTVSASDCPTTAPDAYSKGVTVSAGNTANVSFTYVGLVNLDVYVSGLPAGTPINIPISGPTPLQVTSTFQTFQVRPGYYSYPAQSLTTSGTLSGVVYRWDAPAGGVNVSSSATLNINFSGTGSIVLDIFSPVGADVSLVGNRYTAPGRYILNYLAPGTYGLTANSVSSGGLTYSPNPASASLAVSTGNYAQIGVSYSTGQARMVINLTQTQNSSSWYGGPPGFTIYGVGIFWGGGLANQTYTYTQTVSAGTLYNAGHTNGQAYEMAAYCGWFGCYQRDYWVVYFDGLPVWPVPGNTVTVNVRWVARRCQQQWFGWSCYDF